MLTRTRKIAIGVVVTLSLIAVGIAYYFHDGERGEIRRAFLAYLGDLKQEQYNSAASRVLLNDLVTLKQGAIQLAGESLSFRNEVEHYFKVDTANALVAIPADRFFGFLVTRTFEKNAELERVVQNGVFQGMKIERSGEDAESDARLRLESPDGQRESSLRLSFVKKDDTWFIRL